MSLTCCIIRKPTSTSAGTAASYGMIATSGARRMASEEQQTGHHRRQTGARALADARGGLDVAGVRRDTGRRRPRPRRPSRRPGSARRSAGCPSSSSRSRLGADRGHRAHRVEEVGQHQREDEQQRRHDADLLEGADQRELAERCRSRARRRASSSSAGTLRAQPWSRPSTVCRGRRSPRRRSPGSSWRRSR